MKRRCRGRVRSGWSCEKCGWDSGEIKTFDINRADNIAVIVERVDGTQARLKLKRGICDMMASRVERVDGTQARLKQRVDCVEVARKPMWKGGRGLRRD